MKLTKKPACAPSQWQREALQRSIRLRADKILELGGRVVHVEKDEILFELPDAAGAAFLEWESALANSERTKT